MFCQQSAPAAPVAQASRLANAGSGATGPISTVRDRRYREGVFGGTISTVRDRRYREGVFGTPISTVSHRRSREGVFGTPISTVRDRRYREKHRA